MHRGQALVMILLIMGVAITIVLSVVSRSVTEVNLSGTEEQSSRALQAAEAGIEKSLGGIQPNGTNVSVGVNSTYNVTTTDLTKSTISSGGNTNAYRVPYPLAAGDVMTVALSSYTPLYTPYAGRTLGICWNDGSTSDQPAIEVILYFIHNGSIAVGRAGYDAAVRGGFTAPDSITGHYKGYCNGFNMNYIKEVCLGNSGGCANNLGFVDGDSPLFMRIRILYNNSGAQYLVVDPQGSGPVKSLPKQGNDVVSTGVSGDAAQRVHAVQPNPDLPFMFDAALFSGGDLTQ